MRAGRARAEIAGCGRWRVLGRALLKRKAGARAWAECVGAGWAAREESGLGPVVGFLGRVSVGFGFKFWFSISNSNKV